MYWQQLTLNNIFHSQSEIQNKTLVFAWILWKRDRTRWDEDDATCFAVISLIPPYPYSPSRVRASSTKWHHSSFALFRPESLPYMRTSSRFAPQTRENLERERQFLHFVVSFLTERRCSGWTCYTQTIPDGERNCRDFGTSITCRDKATCRETIETQGQSTCIATARSFSGDSTRRIASLADLTLSVRVTTVALSARCNTFIGYDRKVLATRNLPCTLREFAMMLSTYVARFVRSIWNEIFISTKRIYDALF